MADKYTGREDMLGALYGRLIADIEYYTGWGGRYAGQLYFQDETRHCAELAALAIALDDVALSRGEIAGKFIAEARLYTLSMGLTDFAGRDSLDLLINTRDYFKKLRRGTL